MPDQSSAATEHAILSEITAPLQTLPDDPVAVVVDADFPASLRGYDRVAVDAYVQRTSQLVAELQATRSPEAAVRRALERVGEQISGILQRAHDTGEEITAQSRREAEDRLEKSRAEAAEIEAAAQQRVRDLDVDTDRIWAERHRIVDDARQLAEQLVALAETAADRFPAAETSPYNDEAPTTRAPIGTREPEPIGLPEPDARAEDSEADPTPEAGDPETHADGIDETVAFTPVEAEQALYDEQSAAGGEPSGDAGAARGRGPGSVIPPASQAANRRSSH